MFCISPTSFILCQKAFDFIAILLIVVQPYLTVFACYLIGLHKYNPQGSYGLRKKKRLQFSLPYIDCENFLH